MFNPDFAATITCTHHGRGPRMQLRFLKKCINRCWPQTVFAKWITASEHHTSFNAVGDTSLLIWGPDNAFIATGCKVAERILINIVLNELTNNFDIVIAHLWNWLHASEVEEEWEHDGEYAKGGKAKFDRICSALVDEFNWPSNANHALNNGEENIYKAWISNNVISMSEVEHQDRRIDCKGKNNGKCIKRLELCRRI